MEQEKVITEIKEESNKINVRLTNLEARLNEYIRDYRDDINDTIERIQHLENNNYQAGIEISDNYNKTCQKFLSIETSVKILENRLRKFENNIGKIKEGIDLSIKSN